MITRPNLLLIVLLFMGTLFASCKKEDFRYQNDFEKSFQTWTDFKASSDNSYRYQVGGGSWVGTGWKTTITVKEGKVVQRDYELSFPTDWPGPIPDETAWTENEAELNSHEHTSAAATLTLDDIYEEARNNWLKKRNDAETYFEAKNNGIISSCGYVTNGCQDDCFNGITITFVEAL